MKFNFFVLRSEGGQGADGGGGGIGDPGASDFLSSVPESYRERPYMANIKSNDDLFSQFDNLQGMLGKSIKLPGEEASEEDWNNIYSKLGRPESADLYEFEIPEGAENYARSEEESKAIKDLFHKAGLSAKQAKLLQTGYDQMILEQIKGHESNQAKLDEQFESEINTLFGTEKDKALEVSKNILNEYTPESMKEHVANLDPKSLSIMASVLNGIHSKYMKEDSPGGEGRGAGFQKKSPDQVRAEAAELRQTEAFKNPMHPQHESVVQKHNQLYSSLG